MIELKQEERQIEQEEEADIARRRSEANRVARERGLSNAADETAILSSKEATPENSSPALAPVVRSGEADVIMEELDVTKQDDTTPAQDDDQDTQT